jgi:hypothetical protein
MKLSDLKPGDTVIADAGFTCMAAGPKIVESDDGRGLYVRCRRGRHYLDGQETDDDELVGLSRPAEMG